MRTPERFYGALLPPEASVRLLKCFTRWGIFDHHVAGLSLVTVVTETFVEWGCGPTRPDREAVATSILDPLHSRSTDSSPPPLRKEIQRLQSRSLLPFEDFGEAGVDEVVIFWNGDAP